MPNKGKKYYNNGKTQILLTDEDIIPDGYIRGKLISDTTRKKMSEGQKAYHLNNPKKKPYFYCNNGIKDIRVYDNTIPEGFVLGRRPLSKDVNQTAIQKRRQTCIDRYGDATYNNMQKNRDTLEKHFGSLEAANKNFRDKSKETNLKKYGVENVFQSEEIKQKIKNSVQENYGVDNIFKLPDIQAKAISNSQTLEAQEKRKNTNLKKYGVENVLSSDTIKDKIKLTVQEKFGVPYACMRKEARILGNDSKPNRDFANLLETNNIPFEREFAISNKSYDFKVDNILIELNPYATHNSTWGIFDNPPKDSQYHISKTQLAKDNNYRCIHIWDWDDKNKILHILLNKQKVYAKHCIIKCISEEDCNNFLNTYHLQNTCRNQKLRFGLFFNNELIQIMTFGNPRYNKNYEWELLRLCSKDTYKIVGGAEKLFKHFITQYNPKSIISYCDNSKFTGDVYNKLGFIQLNNTKPSKHWYNPKTHQHYTDNIIRQRGVDSLLNLNYGKGTSNEDILKQLNFVEIYDCGQFTFVYKA